MTDKELTRKICRNVKYLCLIRDVRLGEVEKAIGVSVGYISRTYKGAADFSISKAYRLAEYFGIKVDSLIGSDYYKLYLQRELEKVEKGEIGNEDKQP